MILSFNLGIVYFTLGDISIQLLLSFKLLLFKIIFLNKIFEIIFSQDIFFIFFNIFYSTIFLVPKSHKVILILMVFLIQPLIFFYF